MVANTPVYLADRSCLRGNASCHVAIDTLICEFNSVIVCHLFCRFAGTPVMLLATCFVILSCQLVTQLGQWVYLLCPNLFNFLDWRSAEPEDSLKACLNGFNICFNIRPTFVETNVNQLNRSPNIVENCWEFVEIVLKQVKIGLNFHSTSFQHFLSFRKCWMVLKPFELWAQHLLNRGMRTSSLVLVPSSQS